MTQSIPHDRLARPFAAALSTLSIAFALTGPPPASAQQLDRTLRVFLDCTSFHCDSDYFTQEIPWVQFVRDRQDADVHVLGTRQQTGGGGDSFTLEFQGRGAFEGQRIRLVATTDGDATSDEERTVLVGVVKQGLAPFAISTPDAPTVVISAPAVEAAPVAQEDPWNRWVFSLGVNGFMNGESQQKSLSTSGNVTASRITEDWKIRVMGRGSLSESEFQLSETQTFVSTTESYSGSALIGKSLGPHWTAGGVANWRRSTFGNYQHSARIAPAIEYDFYPYSESTRRLLTVLYTIGPRYNEYDELTIFNEMEETLIEQTLSVGLDVTQPWGNIDASVSGNHYIAKFSDGDDWPEPQYNIDLFGGFNVRLIKGLSFNLFGNYSMVRGQIQLPLGDLTPEERLTRQRELATNYRYFFNFGLSYRFGSIFSNVVNPRLGNLN